jgi:hypothetical protein
VQDVTSDLGGDGMTTTMELTAASIGYLLTAALAGQRYDEAAGLWRELDDSAQVDVVTALGVQARVAVQQAGLPLAADFTRLAGTACAEALTAARMAFEGSGPWRAPQCSHCRELVASALAEIHVKAGVAGGMPAYYVELVCRSAATP